LCSSSAGARPRIISKAFASSLKAAAMFSGCGTACVLLCAWESDVSTSSNVEKKVDRSGRRGACSDVCSFVGMLCSTVHVTSSVNSLRVQMRAVLKLAFVAGHDYGFQR
jgi:hypothetical protein